MFWSIISVEDEENVRIKAASWLKWKNSAGFECKSWEFIGRSMRVHLSLKFKNVFDLREWTSRGTGSSEGRINYKQVKYKRENDITMTRIHYTNHFVLW